MTEESAPNERKAPIVAAVDGSIVAYHVATWAAAEAIWHAQCPVAVAHWSVTDPVSAVESNERIRS
ncbi:hypothetical protein [Nocardia sp. GAS34]|uniref:hypothetical protein n=1 Tax=unclassified Nocardia TaxID=2637762 RepID=UPI003D1D2392